MPLSQSGGLHACTERLARLTQLIGVRAGKLGSEGALGMIERFWGIEEICALDDRSQLRDGELSERIFLHVLVIGLAHIFPRVPAHLPSMWV